MQNNQDSERLRFTRGTWVRPVQTCSDQPETSGVPGGEMSCWMRVLLVFVFKLLFCFVFTFQTGRRSDYSRGFSRTGCKQSAKEGVVCWIWLLQDVVGPQEAMRS